MVIIVIVTTRKMMWYEFSDLDCKFSAFSAFSTFAICDCESFPLFHFFLLMFDESSCILCIHYYGNMEYFFWFGFGQFSYFILKIKEKCFHLNMNENLRDQLLHQQTNKKIDQIKRHIDWKTKQDATRRNKTKQKTNCVGQKSLRWECKWLLWLLLLVYDMMVQIK